MEVKKSHWRLVLDIVLASLKGGGYSSRRLDFYHVNDERFEASTDLYEPRSQVQRRNFQELELATRSLHVYNEKNGTVPRVIATGHFEGINPLVMKIFNLSTNLQDDELLRRAEDCTIFLLKPEDEIHVPMLIRFRYRAKKVVFNRETLEFE